jgi:predicted nicotinamide N-methyase
VLWQVTPRIAEWLVSDSNLLFDTVLDSHSNVLELGCGISGLLALALAPKVNRYVTTDQEYVLKVLRENISQNQGSSKPSRKAIKAAANSNSADRIIPKALDWEKDSVLNLYQDLSINGEADQIHMVIACDCIYNDALIEPFVTTCADICALSGTEKPTVCIVAQQLRSPDVFESWLKYFHAKFRVWRFGDAHLSPDLGSGSGFVVHLGVLRTSNQIQQ